MSFLFKKKKKTIIKILLHLIMPFFNQLLLISFFISSFDQIPFVASLAAIHTIEEINHSNFLPDIKLGYLLCDACAYGTKALDSVQRMLAVNGSATVLSDYTNLTSPIKAFMGERYSELSIPVAKLLGL